MEDSTQALITSGMNTAMMVAFACPGGAPVGAVLALGVFFLETLFPHSPVTGGKFHPSVPPLSQAELQSALASLKNDLINALKNQQTDDVVQQMLTLDQSYHEYWENVGKLTVDGDRYVVTSTNQGTQDFIKHTSDTYFDLQNTTTGVLSTLRTFRNKLQARSLNDASLTPEQVAENRTSTIALYCWICSLTVSYLKAAATWRWGFELLTAWQYDAYKKELAKFNAGKSQFQDFAHLVNNFPGVNTSPNYVPPDWNHWIDTPFCPVPILLKEVVSMLDYVEVLPPDNAKNKPARPGLYPETRDRLKELEAKVSSFDPVTNLGQVPLTKQLMLDAMTKGMARTGAWEQLADQYGLHPVTEDQLGQFQQAIESWKTVAETVNFENHSVAAGETLTNIAKVYYKDPKDSIPDAAKKIYAANFKVNPAKPAYPGLDDPKVLTLGSILKIPLPPIKPTNHLQ